MLHHHNGARRLAAASIRIGSTLVYASVALASAISGAAVALQLGPVSPIGDFLLPPGGRGPAAAIAATAVDKPRRAAAVVPDAAQMTAAVDPELVSAPAAAQLASPVPDRTAALLDERELTFAWGYAQRHPGATAHQAEPHGAAAFASARVATGEPRHAAERQRTSRKTTGFAPSRLAVQFDDPHQALGYADPQSANGSRIFGRTQSPTAPRHRTPSPPPHA